MKRGNISQNVIRRLPRYMRHLEGLDAEGVERVSSAELGKAMGLTPSQIRQDFSCFGEFGQQGYGYSVKILLSELRGILGINKSFSVILIGAGNLGHALIRNFGFGRYSFRLLAAFDVDPALIGSEIAGVKIFSIDYLPEFIRETHVDIAVLAVPGLSAKSIANIVTKNGVKAIWNFTNIELGMDNEGVLVEDISFADSLLFLSYCLSESTAEEQE